MNKTLIENKPHYLILLLISLLIGCGSGNTGKGSESTLTFQSDSFPEIEGMTSDVTAYLVIGGVECKLMVDLDTTLDGQCPDIPRGSHSYTLKYIHLKTDLPLAEAYGSLTLESGQGIIMSFSRLDKGLDYDKDGYTNLGEVMLSTDPRDDASFPFEPAAFYNTGAGPEDIALGDLDGDGVLDVVTANRDSDSVSVLPGNNDGTLQSAREYIMGPAGLQSRKTGGVELGDFNGDSHLDVLAINSGADSDYQGDLAVLLNNGDGTLQPAAFYTAGDYPISAALGDLNGDGHMDVIAANYGSEDLSVLIGNGDVDGTLQRVAPINSESGKVNLVALGDLNGDNRSDLIVSFESALSVAVLLGKGDGTFLSTDSYRMGMVNTLLLGDLNKDNILDLATSIYSSTIMTVHLGKGDGSFYMGAIYEAGNNPESLAIGDLDQDGNMDLITVNTDDGLLAVILGKGDGTFRAPTFLYAGNTPSSAALGDLDGDGDLDVISTNDNPGTIAVLINK